MLSLDQQYRKIKASVGSNWDPNHISVEVWQDKVNFVKEDHALIWGQKKLSRGLLEIIMWGDKSHWNVLFDLLRSTFKKCIRNKERLVE